MVIGSDSRQGLSKAYGSGLVTDQSDTLMIIHIPADRQWAEVMSIPRDSWVNIPACEMGDGQLSAPTQFKINEAFAIGNLDGNHTALGVACTVKTRRAGHRHLHQPLHRGQLHRLREHGRRARRRLRVQPDPDQRPELRPAPGRGHPPADPGPGARLRPGQVHARRRQRPGADRPPAGVHVVPGQPGAERAARPARDLPVPRRGHEVADHRQPARRHHRPLRPGPVAARHPVEQDRLLHDPELPARRRGPGDTANVLWTQPEDSQIFASFRDDVPASSTLFAVGAAGATTSSVAAACQPTASTGSAVSTPGTPAQRPPPRRPTRARRDRPASTSAHGQPVTIQARTANQSICAG